MRKHSLSRWALHALHALLAIAWSANAMAKSCNVAGGGVAFGSYNPASSAALQATGSLSLHCDENANVTLSLSLGNGAGANYSTGRKMTRAGGAGTLTYNLYADAARSHVLGDGTGGSVTLNLRPSKNTTLAQPIYGRMPGSQSAVLPGSYGDTVIATISY